MRKDLVRNLEIAFVVFVILTLLSIYFFEEINAFEPLSHSAMPLFFIFFIIAVLCLLIAKTISTKEDSLYLGKLVSGKDYILIDHVSVDGEKLFSLVRKSNSEKLMIVQNEDLYKLNPKDHFVVVNKQIRRII